MKVAAYTRVSTTQQAEEGFSLEAQQASIVAYVERQGWQLVETFVERGESGRLASRTELDRLLAQLDSFDVLVIPKLDRLGRSNKGLLDLFDQLEAAGVDLVSLNEQIDSTTAGGKFVRSMFAAMAQLGSDQISERVRAVSVTRAKAGRYHGGPRPYGYRPNEGVLEIVPEEATIVRRIFDRFLAGQTQRQIACDLNDDNVPTPTGAPWTQVTTGGVLRNPVLRGKLKLKGKLYDGAHEPIVDDDTWNAVATLRASRRRPGQGRGRPSGRHLFTRGMLKCRCGASMVVHSGTDSYECLGRKNDPRSCSQSKIKRELIDSSMTAYFESEGYDSDATHRELVHAAQARLSEAQQLRKQAEREVTKATAWLDNITTDYRDGKIDGAAWSKLTAKAESERDAAEAQAARLRRREMTAVPPADEQLAEIRASLGSADVAEIRAALGRLFIGFYLGTSDLADNPEPAPESDNLLDPVEVGGGLMVWAELSPAAVLGIDDDQAPILERQPIHRQNGSDALPM